MCEGYTDVIGFHRAGVPRAVATCGTAFTEDHVRLVKRFASRVVLAFDADAAGQGAAERFYEWERKYQIEVSVARLPEGVDPGALAERDPPALAAAVDDATPFLAFRLRRVVDRHPARTPEERARLAQRAMAVVNEHPDVNVRTLYAGEIAAQTGLAVADLVNAAKRRQTVATGGASPQQQVLRENAEFAALAVARPGLGPDRRLARRSLVPRRRPPPRVPRPGGGRRRSRRRPRRRRSRRPRRPRAGSRRGRRRRPGGRGPQSDRRRRAPGAGGAGDGR